MKINSICAFAFLSAVFCNPIFAETKTNPVVNGLDIGPLSGLIGTWRTADRLGTDVSPGQEGSPAGKGAPVVEPFYEVMTFEVVADAKNASEQYLTAVYYKQEAFRKRDNGKFHDQRGYLIYDKKNQVVYNNFCIPRSVCIVSESKAGPIMDFKLVKEGIAQSPFMEKKDTVTGFSMTFDLSEPNKIKYLESTELFVYGKKFNHVDQGVLEKEKI